MKVKEYYKDKNFLITGCTGFLAKVLLEKLLRTCPDVGNIYIMVRPKKGIKPMMRVKKEILSSECFDEIRR